MSDNQAWSYYPCGYCRQPVQWMDQVSWVCMHCRITYNVHTQQCVSFPAEAPANTYGQATAYTGTEQPLANGLPAYASDPVSAAAVPNPQPRYYYGTGPSNDPTIVKPEVGTVRIRNAADARRKGPAPFTCPNCDATFTRKHNLENHMNSHEDIRPHLCRQPGCGRSFTRRHDRNRHEEACHGLKVEE